MSGEIQNMHVDVIYKMNEQTPSILVAANSSDLRHVPILDRLGVTSDSYAVELTLGLFG